MTIDPQVFRETMAHWASGVTVVTTLVEGKPSGITASSFASLSLHPPQILVCITKNCIRTKRLKLVEHLPSIS